jgi:hypothetical protein
VCNISDRYFRALQFSVIKLKNYFSSNNPVFVYVLHYFCKHLEEIFCTLEVGKKSSPRHYYPSTKLHYSTSQDIVILIFASWKPQIAHFYVLFTRCLNLFYWVTAWLKNYDFRNITPCSSLRVDWRFGGDRFLRNVSWLSTEYRVLYPEDRTLHYRRCQNLRSYTFALWSLNLVIIFWVINYTSLTHNRNSKIKICSGQL